MPPTVGGNKRWFFRPSVCLSVHPFVCLSSVAYKANNSRTQRPSVPKLGRKVPHLRFNWHTSFKVKWSKVRFGGSRWHTVSAEPGGDTACYASLCTATTMRWIKVYYIVIWKWWSYLYEWIPSNDMWTLQVFTAANRAGLINDAFNLAR